jgi:redox-sensitive bicupin YhaK (pirin superfamily)
VSIRAIKKVLKPKPTLEGAGVKLQRGFGFGDPKEFDPFLLFDDFRNDNPDEYLAGFPWHPHRGIETITYVLAGQVDHGDSLGNSGTLSGGDVQWMTAGSGIIHQEMPKGDDQGRMHGFQLWANLPSSLKMTTPRYQDVAGKDIPDVVDDDGTRVRVCAETWEERLSCRRHRRRSHLSRCVGPTRQTKTLPVETSRHAFAYVLPIGHVPQRLDPRAVKTDGI